MTQKALLQGAGDGTAVPAGYVGQVIQASPATNITPGASGVNINICSITLTPGIWQINAKASWLSAPTPPSNFTAIYGGIGITPSAWEAKWNFSMYPVQFGSAQTAGVCGTALVNISSNTTYYLNASANHTGLNGAVWITDSVIIAVRIA